MSLGGPEGPISKFHDDMQLLSIVRPHLEEKGYDAKGIATLMATVDQIGSLVVMMHFFYEGLPTLELEPPVSEASLKEFLETGTVNDDLRLVIQIVAQERDVDPDDLEFCVIKDQQRTPMDSTVQIFP